MTLVKIDVTKYDFSRGIPNSSLRCPVHYAVKRHVKDNLDVFVRYSPRALGSCMSVELEKISAYTDGMCSGYEIKVLANIALPANVEERIRSYDSDPANNKEPYSFELEIPANLLRKTNVSS